MNISFDLNAQVLVAAVSAIIAAVALFLAWRQARERQLRRDDVLKWANEAIRSLQTLYLICFVGDSIFDSGTIKKMLADAAVTTSVLVEQGRLYFRNLPHPSYGADRYEAYRGYRPVLLDPIVVMHQIACRWEDADEEERHRMTLVAEDCVKEFVSLAQKEVGRSKTASVDVARQGAGKRLEELLEAIPATRLEALRSSGRLSL